MRSACNFVDLTGLRFGKRIVLHREQTPIYRGKKGSSVWRVRCACGRESVIPTSTVKNTTSCGCDKSYAVRSGVSRRSSLPLSARRNKAHLKRTFGLTVDQFEKMRFGQNNRCAVCHEEFVVTPSVDHDHGCCAKTRSCGKCIRGLLCKRCNAGLGSVHDRIDLLESAILYLKAYQSH
jgi:hypothetical protein